MKILVTGGAGFIGSHIVDEYIRLGHRVWVIDNVSSGNKKQVNKEAVFAKIDVTDTKKLARFFKGKKFDVVNHLAAQIDVRKSVLDPVFDARVNILGILNLLKLSCQEKVKQFIFSSSGGTVYGECPGPVTESAAEVPMSPYGVAKLSSEKYIKTFASLYGLRYTIFRYSNVYGPRQDPKGEAGVVSIFCEKFLSKEPATIFGDGTQTRDFVYVKDVALVNGLALHLQRNETINIGIAQEISVSRLYDVLAKVAGVQKSPLYKVARAGEIKRSVLDNSYAKKVLNWQPTYSLEAGLSETFSYFKNKRGKN